MFAQKLKRSLAVDAVAALKEFDFSLVGQARLRIKPTRLGVFMGHPRIQSDAVEASRLCREAGSKAAPLSTGSSSDKAASFSTLSRAVPPRQHLLSSWQANFLRSKGQGVEREPRNRADVRERAGEPGGRRCKPGANEVSTRPRPQFRSEARAVCWRRGEQGGRLPDPKLPQALCRPEQGLDRKTITPKMNSTQ